MDAEGGSTRGCGAAARERGRWAAEVPREESALGTEGSTERARERRRETLFAFGNVESLKHLRSAMLSGEVKLNLVEGIGGGLGGTTC